jgi:hypothetical protein
MEDKIIPFGKYKGQPVEAMAGDKKYIEWLVTQIWFKEEHLNLYNIVTNNFREIDTSPEYTMIRNKFLKPEYRVKLAYLVNPELFHQNSENINAAMQSILNAQEPGKSNHFLHALANPVIDDEFGLYTNELLKLSKPTLENIDAYFSIWYGMQFYYDNDNYFGGWSQFKQEMCTSYWVCIRPSINDDYEAILRQLTATIPIEKNEYQRDKYFILVAGEYKGTNISKDELVSFVEEKGYRMVFENEIDNVTLPDFDREFKLDLKIQEMLDQILKTE